MAVDTVTIELPYFCRHKDHAYMNYCITEDETVLTVLTSPSGGFMSTSTEVSKILNDFSLEQITREEFVQVFAQVTDSFTKILPYDGQ